MKFSLSELKIKTIELLEKSFSQADAARIGEYLIWAEMSGYKTQGILKLTGTEPLQNIKPKHALIRERDTKLSQLINAGAHPAPLASQMATDVVIEKAKQHGFAIVGVHNTYSSNGAQAFCVERIARQDLIGIAVSRSPGSTCAFDSIDPVFGTNPMGIAFPTTEHPLVFDMATSAMTYYGLILAKARGEEIPDNMAIDSDGNITKDPATAMTGALLPFDRSYKSSGIGMVVEILAGPLASSAFCDFKTFDQEWGSTFIAIDPGLLVDSKTFKSNCSALIEKIRTSRRRPGVGKIRLPGDRAHEAREEVEKQGVVEIDRAILAQLGFL